MKNKNKNKKDLNCDVYILINFNPYYQGSQHLMWPQQE